MSNHLNDASRRLFLKQAYGLTATAHMGAPLAFNLAAMSAMAADNAADYKALVCVFLHGGNDSYNTVLATDRDSWQHYIAARQQAPTPIALDPSLLLSLSPRQSHPGRQFGLHPTLKTMARLFNEDRTLAIVPNVGPLIEPLNKQQYRQQTRAIPAKLFSHNDQQSTWLSFAPEGGTLGWGGRMADAIASANDNSMFAAVSYNTSTVWLAGKDIRPYQVSVQGGLRPGTQMTALGEPHIYGSRKVHDALEQILQAPRSKHMQEVDLCEINRHAIDAAKVLSDKLPPASTPGFELGAAINNSLANQFQIVARMISAHPQLGVKRQVFFVSLAGFDTHDRQNKRHAELLAQLDQAFQYFDQTIRNLGLGQQVTTFTASDFGRTFTSNGDGTDHGWGGHHFVMGGAVNGGEIRGAFPVYASKSRTDNEFPDSPDMLSNGSLLPALSVQSYGATLGQWFGLSPAQLTDVFPLLDRMDPNTQLKYLFRSV